MQGADDQVDGMLQHLIDTFGAGGARSPTPRAPVPPAAAPPQAVSQQPVVHAQPAPVPQAQGQEVAKESKGLPKWVPWAVGGVALVGAIVGVLGMVRKSNDKRTRAELRAFQEDEALSLIHI